MARCPARTPHHPGRRGHPRLRAANERGAADRASGGRGSASTPGPRAWRLGSPHRPAAHPLRGALVGMHRHAQAFTRPQAIQEVSLEAFEDCRCAHRGRVRVGRRGGSRGPEPQRTGPPSQTCLSPWWRRAWSLVQGGRCQPDRLVARVTPRHRPPCARGVAVEAILRDGAHALRRDEQAGQAVRQHRPQGGHSLDALAHQACPPMPA
jgi:hypothetical protein